VVGAASVTEYVARSLGAARARPRGGPELGVLVGGVVRHQVDDHAQARGMGLQQQAVEVLERAEQRIDGAVIRDIVAGVGLRRAVEGGQL